MNNGISNVPQGSNYGKLGVSAQLHLKRKAKKQKQKGAIAKLHVKTNGKCTCPQEKFMDPESNSFWQ